MKYSAVFVIMSAIIIIICGLGVAFIWHNQNPQRNFISGTNAYEVGDYNRAIKDLGDYLSYGYINDDSQIARYYLAASVNRKREYLTESGGITGSESRLLDERAKHSFMSVINGNKRNNKYVEAVIGYAEICYRSRTQDTSITHKLEDVLHSYPNSRLEDQIYTYLGYQYLFARDYRRAMNAFLNSSTQLAKMGKAETHIQLKQFESAFKIYEDFFDYFQASIYIDKVKSSYLKYVNQFAILKTNTGNYTEAILTFKKLIHYFPDSVNAENARFSIGNCYMALENYKSAIDYYTMAYKDASTKLNDSALFKIGLCHYELGEMTAAYRVFNQLLNQYPTSIYLSKSREWVKQLRKELEYFQQ